MKLLCFFGLHAYERDDNGWTDTCTRCGRLYVQTPVGGFESPGWFAFWFGGSK